MQGYVEIGEEVRDCLVLIPNHIADAADGPVALLNRFADFGYNAACFLAESQIVVRHAQRSVDTARRFKRRDLAFRCARADHIHDANCEDGTVVEKGTMERDARMVEEMVKC